MKAVRDGESTGERKSDRRWGVGTAWCRGFLEAFGGTERARHGGRSKAESMKDRMLRGETGRDRKLDEGGGTRAKDRRGRCEGRRVDPPQAEGLILLLLGGARERPPRWRLPRASGGRPDEWDAEAALVEVPDGEAFLTAEVKEAGAGERAR